MNAMGHVEGDAACICAPCTVGAPNVYTSDGCTVLRDREPMQEAETPQRAREIASCWQSAARHGYRRALRRKLWTPSEDDAHAIEMAENVREMDDRERQGYPGA